VSFGDTDDPPYFTVKKIHLGMKGKKIVYLDIENVSEFNEKLLERYHIKLTLRGTSEQFKVFRRGKRYSDLRKKGVKFSYDPVASDVDAASGEARSRKEVSYTEVLKSVVQTKTEAVKDAYREIVGADVDAEEEEEKVIYELVFEDDSESEEDLESEDLESEDIGSEEDLDGSESEENWDSEDIGDGSSDDEIYLDEDE